VNRIDVYVAAAITILAITPAFFLSSGITQNRPVRVTSKPDNGEGSGH
jgi:hypothetical protein